MNNENVVLETAIELIKRFEGYHLKAYLCPARVWTIGFGTTKINGIRVAQGMEISQEQAENLLLKDCEMFYNAVIAEIGNLCNERQMAALVSFVYNVGVGAFAKSTLLKTIKQNPNDAKIANEFMRWVFGGGKKLNGLIRRRKAEVQLYFS